MKSKVEKWLEKRAQDIKEEWEDDAKWRCKKCESPIEELFLIEWIYREKEENLNPEGFPKFYIYPQYKINNKYRVDFLVIYIPEDDWLECKRNYNNIKDKTLIVELDSHLWHGTTSEQFTKEKERERELQKEGWHIMRFSGREVYRNVEKCIDEVIKYFKDKEEKELLGYSNDT